VDSQGDSVGIRTTVFSTSFTHRILQKIIEKIVKSFGHNRLNIFASCILLIQPRKRQEQNPTSMEDSTSIQLHWIDPSTSKSPFNRSKIRQEVMQKVALRRKEGPKQIHPNSRQLPIFIPHNKNRENRASGGREEKSHSVKIVPQDSLLLSENLKSDRFGSEEFDSLTSLTRMRVFAMTCPPLLAKFNLNILDLSLLASPDIGRYTGERLLQSPQNLAYFLGGRNWSFCRYVPRYYEQSVVVQVATDCVLARVRSLLNPEQREWEPLAVSSYRKALSVLQDAINSASRLPSADILCATQILGLYEVRLRLLYVLL
jgi:hypothetical protein